MNTRKTKPVLPLIIGALLGAAVYVALSFSGISLKLDLFINGYFQYLGVIESEVERAPSLITAGLGLIVIMLAVFIQHTEALSLGQKTSLFTILALLTISCCPVLIMWDMVWNPCILIFSTLWGVACEKFTNMALTRKKVGSQKEIITTLSDNDLA